MRARDVRFATVVTYAPGSPTRPYARMLRPPLSALDKAHLVACHGAGMDRGRGRVKG